MNFKTMVSYIDILLKFILYVNYCAIYISLAWFQEERATHK
jgi:hypothetical protein